MSSNIPRGTQLPADTKKTGHKIEKDAILKSQENVPMKNVASKIHKGVSTRYRQQAELTGQNQHLMATNEQLQKNLTDSQQRVANLELQLSELEKRNAGLHKNLKDCHAVLVAAKVDPVLGERVGEATQQNEDQRKEVMSVSTNLLQELKAFGDIASQQYAQLEKFKALLTDLGKAREHIQQERENFSREAIEMENAFKEAEALLL